VHRSASGHLKQSSCHPCGGAAPFPIKDLRDGRIGVWVVPAACGGKNHPVRRRHHTPITRHHMPTACDVMLR
jgi:hypothetical protein